MTAKLLSRRDLEFLLYEWLDVAALCQRPRYADHSRETFDGALETAERIATEVFLPHRRKSDVQEPEFDGERVHLIPEGQASFKAFAEAGLLAAAQDYEFGGMQLPAVVDKACFAYVLAANAGRAGYPLLTAANANLLLAHGSPAQIDAFARPELEGRFAGTIFWKLSISGFEFLLYLDCTLNRIYYTAKLSQNIVTRSIHHPASLMLNETSY